MRAPRLGRNSCGFTLIEVVLALNIFALIGAVLYGAFSLSHSAVEKSQASFADNQKLRSFTDLLGSYVRSAYPYRESAQQASVFFDGQEDQLTFVSSISLAMGGRGMSKIRVSWDGAEQGGGPIQLEEELPVRLNVNESQDDGGLRNEVVLQERVKELRFAYLDPKSEDERWEERWDGREKMALPRAVRLTYRDRDGRAIRWIFPVMISVLAQ
jgi:prepilin-type N-terminal cleavage/methylation domain-containing protein